jgi:hypothetical protein
MKSNVFPKFLFAPPGARGAICAKNMVSRPPDAAWYPIFVELLGKSRKNLLKKFKGFWLFSRAKKEASRRHHGLSEDHCGGGGDEVPLHRHAKAYNPAHVGEAADEGH